MSARVLIVDDHPLVRDGLRLLIDGQSDMEVVGEAVDGPTALDTTDRVLPDVIIMDVEMPGGSGIDVLGDVLAAHPNIKVLMLSAFPDPGYVTKSVRAGASGYLIKGDAPSEIVKAIRAAVNGHTFMCPEATSVLVSALKDSLAGQKPRQRPLMSGREREVLILVAEGLRTKEIAARLNIGVKSVDTYRARLMKKLECGSTAELVRYAIREGLTSA